MIGPLADSQRDTLGPWIFNHDLAETVTILDGVRARAGDGVEVRYAAGVRPSFRTFPSMFDMWAGNTPDDPTDFDEDAEIAAAAEVARASDVAVVVAGEWQNMIGESASRSSLELPGRQLDLIKAVVATGTPVVLLVMNGRPLDLRWPAENVPAILDVWYPGSQGGHAVAALLFGDDSPAGRLPFSWPRTVGQVPIIYSHTRSHDPSKQWRRYWDEESTPLYPFGHGLSYGAFSYSAADPECGQHHRRRLPDRHGHRDQHRRPAGGGRRPALPAPAVRDLLAPGPRAQGVRAGGRGPGRVGDGRVHPR